MYKWHIGYYEGKLFIVTIRAKSAMAAEKNFQKKYPDKKIAFVIGQM